VWDECSGFPFIEGEGIFNGPEVIASEFFTSIPENHDEFAISIDELFGSGDKVVRMGHYDGKWKESGKPFHANATHIWTLKEGKAIGFFQAVDTAEIVNPK
jgi:ketosteroid isomerase-like protein